MNTQAIEKQDHHEDGSVEVHSMFYTIQGEGPFTGVPAIFVRLAGCNLRCPGCDTEYTSKRTRYGASRLIEEIKDLAEEEGVDGVVKLVVITGGEPFRQNIAQLCNMLVFKGYDVQIETNGTLPPPEGLQWRGITIVCSPKTGKIDKDLVPRISALKYVAKVGQIARDGLPTRALDHTASPCVARPPEHFSGPVYLQPMDEANFKSNRDNTKAVVDACLKHGHTVQLQLHKLIGLD